MSKAARVKENQRRGTSVYSKYYMEVENSVRLVETNCF